MSHSARRLRWSDLIFDWLGNFHLRYQCEAGVRAHYLRDAFGGVGQAVERRIKAGVRATSSPGPMGFAR